MKMLSDKVLYIIRGCSGSGKSTFADLLSSSLDFKDPGSTVSLEADQYWYTLGSKDGKYAFDISRLGDAHSWCQEKVLQNMRGGVYNIILSNTNTSEKEMGVYLDMAEDFGYSVVSLVVENRHGNNNIHGVPQATLDKQAQRVKQSLKLLP